MRAVDSPTTTAMFGLTMSAEALRPTAASMRSSMVPTPARNSKAARKSVRGPKVPLPSSKTINGRASCLEIGGEIDGELEALALIDAL